MRTLQKTTVRLLAIVVSLAMSLGAQNSTLWAQNSGVSGYAAQALEQLRNRNSVSNYSIGRLQNQNVRSSVPSVGVFGVNQRNFLSSAASRPKSKPFSGVSRGSSVSPYLALSNPFSTVSDYYNIVRPQQEQARTNELLQRETMLTNQRLSQLAQENIYNIRGDEEAVPTGHAAVFQSLGNFNNTGSYYPVPQQSR